MIFNFWLANHHSSSLNSFGDLVEPICLGLEAGGHHVIRYGQSFHEAPMVNVLMEFFIDDNHVTDVLRIKRELGDRFRFGLLCTEDPEDRLVMDIFPNRLPNLRRLAAVADFIWTLLPVEEFYHSMCAPERVALLRYGYVDAYREPDIITDPRRRDIDVLLYGNRHPHRETVIRALFAQGLSCILTDRERLPDFAAADLIRRSKIVLDVRRSPAVRFLSPTRIVRALHSGAAVVSERYDEGPLAPLYDYTVACPYEEVANRCAEIIRSGRYVEAGLSALARFQAETSMRDNLASLLSRPALAPLAAS